MDSTVERILILCKTYPSPSKKYTETSCVAGMTDSGQLIRLFPVPFRIINDEQQFRKWQWITARIGRPPGDNRPDSRRLFVDTIDPDDAPLSTAKGWAHRRAQIDRLEIFESPASLERSRQERGVTLGLVRPKQVTRFVITATSKEWSKEELEKLQQMQAQGNLFGEDETESIRLLRKMPIDMHYEYECADDGVPTRFKHKVTDWEACALYWNVCRKANWEQLLRQKMEQDLPAMDLMFLMGTMHRFPDQWLIVSVIYPPKPTLQELSQQSLFP